MSTDDEPKPDKMDEIIGAMRIELVYSNERTERHLMPSDHPPVPHICFDTCWCEPELVFKSKRWAIYRHRRQQ